MSLTKAQKSVFYFLSSTIRLGRLIVNRIHQRMADEDQHLIGPHMGILWDLGNKDGVRQQDLAVSSLKDKATIARALKILEEEALVLRAPDPIDRRTKRIYITPKGRKVLERMRPLGAEVMQEARAGIPAEDLEVYDRVVKQLYDNLNEKL